MRYTEPITRRALLQSMVVAFCAIAGLGLKARPIPVDGRSSVIGWSQGGRPMIVYRYGRGPLLLFLLGGQHGGPEANTTELAKMLMAYLAENPGQIPRNVTVYVMPVGNPDGLALGSRQYISGVDPNRNWASPDWQSDAYDSNGRYRRGLGGPEPFSEQETAVLGGWLLRIRPHFTINYHSAGGFMFGGGDPLHVELADLYSQASGYPGRAGVGGSGGGSGGGSRLGYRATGHMNGWQRSVGMGGCLIELTSPYDPEFDRNLAGIRSILARLEAEGGR